MNIIITAIVTGITGTIAMDSLNLVFSRMGLISKIDIGMIGRMTAGWAGGKFFYMDPGEMKAVKNEKLYGYISHCLIGICLALPYILGWVCFFGGSVSSLWAIPYGISTTVASWFFVYPSMGMGICGRKSPEGIKPAVSSFANHLFYGAGIALGIILIKMLR